jgi:hypothetical protein
VPPSPPSSPGQALIARRASAALGISARQGYAQLLGIDPAAHARVLDLPALAGAAGAFERQDGIVLGSSLGAAARASSEGDEVVLREIGGRTLTLRSRAPSASATS